MNQTIQTLKGFRDFLPAEARKRQYVIEKLKTVFESFGFEPLETPVLEYEEILLGKYGEEGDKLMYRFTDNGERRVAMRYDQTVPLARVAAQYATTGVITLPFKRYQIQNVWRAENTQKGRYREFLQCDIDSLGSESTLADAEIIAVTAACFTTLGFKNFKVLINDRKVFEDLNPRAITVIDKLKKIGVDGVIAELVEKKLAESAEQAKEILERITSKTPTPQLEAIIKYAQELGINENNLVFEPTLARGLDYYTGLILEIETPDYPFGSLAGGGRYDNLVGMFSKDKIPAVGLAFGFDRTVEAMEALKLFPEELSGSKVLVTIFSAELVKESLAISSQLRSNNISSEIYLDENTKMEKQLKYADKKGIPYVAIIGPDEAAKNEVTIKDLKNRTQKTISITEAVKELTTDM